MPIAALGWRASLLLLALAAAGAAVAGPQPRQLLPLQPTDRIFRVADEKARTDARLVLAPAEDEQGLWRLSLSGFNDVYLKSTDEGIFITQVRISEENKRIVFLQPLPLLPPELTAGQEARLDTEVHVYNLETGERTHTGKVAHRAVAAGPARFALPAGEREGYRIELRQTMEFDLVTLEVNLATGYVPDWGIVQRQLDYEVEVFGMPFARNSRSAELAEAQVAEAQVAGH